MAVHTRWWCLSALAASLVLGCGGGEGPTEAGPDAPPTPRPDVAGDVRSDVGPEDVSAVEVDGGAIAPDSSPHDDVAPEPDATADDDTTPSDASPAEDVAPPPDMGEDTTPADDTTEPGPDPGTSKACGSSLVITSPTANTFYALGDSVMVEAAVAYDPADGASLDQLTVQWQTSHGAALGTSAVGIGGGTSLMATLSAVQNTELTAQLVFPDGTCLIPDTTPIHVCAERLYEDFTTSPDPATWVLLDSATWVSEASGQWIELTPSLFSTAGYRGELYNSDVNVASGNVSVRFDFATGGGINGGADGLALTIMDVDTVADMVDMISSAYTGGGQGYAVSGYYGDWEGDALHVEVDTWHNVYNGTNELHTDPTEQNHLAIAQNGDPAMVLWWEAIPSVEDMAWHSFQLDVIGDTFKVYYDGVLHTEQYVPGLNFRGGYLYFSASTGYATNHHQVDNVDIVHACP